MLFSPAGFWKSASCIWPACCDRQVMHRVRRYDDTQPRDMRRTTIRGEAPTTAQV